MASRPSLLEGVLATGPIMRRVTSCRFAQGFPDLKASGFDDGVRRSLRDLRLLTDQPIQLGGLTGPSGSAPLAPG
jgi:hypothetical protein